MRSLRVAARAASCAALAAVPSAAQSSLEWFASHDGPFAQTDYGRACAVDSMGNVTVAGRSYNPTSGVPPMPPSADFELAQWSPGGALRWSARRDGFGAEDVALDAACAPNGDVYVSGYSWNANGIDWTVLKHDSNGAFQWIRHHAGAGGGSDFARALAFDAAGNLLVCGNESAASGTGDALLRCYDPAGNVLWSTAFDGGAGGDDALYALSVLPGGEILACGQFAGASGGANIGVAKLSGAGQLLWSRADDGGGGLADGAAALAPLDATRVLLGGWRTSATGEDWHLSVYDHVAQTRLWSATFNGSANGNERVRSVAVDGLGVLWATGTAASAGAGLDIATRRYDAAGALLTGDVWNNVGVQLDEQPFKLLLGSAGQAYVAGYSTLSGSPLAYAPVVLQYDTLGARNWAAIYPLPAVSDARIFDAELAPGQRIVGGGYMSSATSNGYDYLAVQIDVSTSPQGYCTAKLNSLGCAAELRFSGLPSASASYGFTVRVRELRNNKNGLVFYGLNGPASSPFQGGYLCVQPPLRRTPLAATQGNPVPADDCSGSVTLDLNAFARGLQGGAPAPELSVPGTDVHCQFWSRDPGASFQTNLSSALSYRVLP